MTVGRDSVLVKEEHKFQWSGTNGINTSLTYTYGNLTGNPKRLYYKPDNSEAIITTSTGNIYSSTNGTTWTGKTSPVSSSISGITYWASKSLWMLVEGKNVWTAPTNMSSWTLRGTSSENLKDIDAGLVTYNSTDTDYGIVAGDNGMTGYSTNGTSWSFLDTSTSSSRDFQYVLIADKVITISGGNYSVGLYACENPTTTSSSNGGWRSVDKSSNGIRTANVCVSGGGVKHIRFLNGKHWLTGSQSESHLVYDPDGNIYNQWNVVYDNDNFRTGSIKDIAYGNNQYINIGRNQLYWNYSGGCSNGVVVTPNPQDQPFLEYSLNGTSFTQVLLGMSNLTYPEEIGFVGSKFVVISTYSSSNYNWYATSGVGGDTVSVTFDSFFASSPITYPATPGSNSAVQQDLDLFNALTKAINDGDLNGVTVTNLGSGNGVTIVNTVQGSYNNPTVSGSSATCTVTTTLDN